MILKPLGDRVLVKPIENPTTTESGLLLAEDRKPETMGTVIAVGFCSHPLKVEAEDMAERLDQAVYSEYGTTVCSDANTGREAVDLLRRLVSREPLVKSGDTVLFSWTSGQELHLEDDGERYLLMRESDLLAVVE